MNWTVLFTYQFCISTAGVIQNESLDNLTKKLEILEWPYKKKINFESIDKYLRCAKTNIESLYNHKILHYVLCDTLFMTKMPEYINKLSYFIDALPKTLAVIKIMILKNDARAKDKIVISNDALNIDTSYTHYLDILLEEVRFQVSKHTEDEPLYDETIVQIHLLKDSDSSNIPIAEKTLLRHRVIEMTYLFCIQSVLSQLFLSVNEFFGEYDKFFEQNLEQRDDIIYYSTRNDGCIKMHSLASTYFELYEIRATLDGLALLFAEELGMRLND